MTVRCAIYTRKSTEEGLEQDFNSLDAQREACAAYIQSQRSLGWKAISKHYDDGGISGGTLERPALKDLLADIEAGRIDLVVVYKVDRLTRSLMDFSKIIETFDAKEVSFVSVTQQFNTANSMGRLTLNMLLSFAQFEREVTAERIRDKIAASKRKGMWMGGLPPLGYDVRDKKLVVNSDEAVTVRQIFGLYLEIKSVRKLQAETERLGLRTKRRVSKGKDTGGKPLSRGHLYCLLHNPIYIGDVTHKGERFEGQHDAIIDQEIWDKTQALLADQAPRRASTSNVDRRCLLTDLIVDETCDRLSPTYAKKDGRIHAYYVSQRLISSGGDKDGGWRLPAQDLEAAIIEAVAAFFEDENKWSGSISGSHSDSSDYREARARAAAICHQLRSNDCVEVRRVLRDVVARCTVAPGSLRIVLKSEYLYSGGGSHEITLPFHTKRRGVECRIILGNGKASNADPDANLIAAIKRSFRWWRRLTQEDGWSIQKLAEQDKMDASDVTRLLPLAFLAPEIIEAIVDGQQPVDLNLERFKKMGSLPISWTEQREVLGFPR